LEYTIAHTLRSMTKSSRLLLTWVDASRSKRRGIIRKMMIIILDSRMAAQRKVHPKGSGRALLARC
jgi:hypothetical protein